MVFVSILIPVTSAVIALNCLCSVCVQQEGEPPQWDDEAMLESILSALHNDARGVVACGAEHDSLATGVSAHGHTQGLPPGVPHGVAQGGRGGAWAAERGMGAQPMGCVPATALMKSRVGCGARSPGRGAAPVYGGSTMHCCGAEQMGAQLSAQMSAQMGAQMGGHMGGQAAQAAAQAYLASPQPSPNGPFAPPGVAMLAPVPEGPEGARTCPRARALLVQRGSGIRDCS
eukprot:4589772-Pleurochrysis_carterae.AAC.6